MNFFRHTVLPIVAAFIWGTAFVSQVQGSKTLDAFSFNMARSVVASIFLFFPLILLLFPVMKQL